MSLFEMAHDSYEMSNQKWPITVDELEKYDFGKDDIVTEQTEQSDIAEEEGGVSDQKKVGLMDRLSKYKVNI